MTTATTTSTKSQSLKYASYPDGLDMYLEYIVPEKATPENKAPIYLWFVSPEKAYSTSSAR